MNTNSKVIVGVLVGLIVGGGGVYASIEKNSVSEKGAMQHQMANGEMMGGESMSMHGEMSAMNAALQGKTGDSFDQAFLTEMTVHHQGAVEMAQLALTNAKHQEIKDLATAIITAQNKEIAEMQSWQKQWYGGSTAQ